MDTVRAEGNEEIVLLHCVSIYPAAPSTIHLRNLETLRQAFDVPVGFSDHTLGTAIPLAAIALGACVIEKHFTLDKEMEGWDHAISSDPPELRAIVEDGRTIHEALGSTRRMLSEAEIVKRRQFRRSLVTRAALPAGHVLTEADLDAKRPGNRDRPRRAPLCRRPRAGRGPRRGPGASLGAPALDSSSPARGSRWHAPSTSSIAWIRRDRSTNRWRRPSNASRPSSGSISSPASRCSGSCRRARSTWAASSRRCARSWTRTCWPTTTPGTRSTGCSRRACRRRSGSRPSIPKVTAGSTTGSASITWTTTSTRGVATSATTTSSTTTRASSARPALPRTASSSTTTPTTSAAKPIAARRTGGRRPTA